MSFWSILVSVTAAPGIGVLREMSSRTTPRIVAVFGGPRERPSNTIDASRNTLSSVGLLHALYERLDVRHAAIQARPLLSQGSSVLGCGAQRGHAWFARPFNVAHAEGEQGIPRSPSGCAAWKKRNRGLRASRFPRLNLLHPSV